MVFRGRFECGGLLAPYPYFAGLSRVYTQAPDLELAERLLQRSAALDASAYFVYIDLGNVCLKRGSRECALDAYRAALQHADADPDLKPAIAEQIRRVSSEPLDRVPELRDPFLE
jgi:tetratricopeptide (TPR) repeat protein